MASTFVGINEPLHRFVRALTRHVPLQMTRDAEGRPCFSYSVRAVDLPEDYFQLAMLHSISGMPLECISLSNWKARPEDKPGIAAQVGYFDITRLDRRCSRDLRLRPVSWDAVMLSGEILSYGVGTLRACNDDTSDPLHSYLLSHHGQIEAPCQKARARIVAMHLLSTDRMASPQRERYESTNVVYGDVIGELEQLWDRRADTEFLDAVALSLRDFRRRGQFSSYHHPPLNLPGILQLHLRHSTWTRPPTSGRVLLSRVEHILENLSFDTADADSSSTKGKSKRNRRRQKRGGGSWNDPGGYEGWLTPPES